MKSPYCALLSLFLALPLGSPAEPANLLAANPGFEAPGVGAFYHGDYSIPGWKGNNPMFGAHRATGGNAPEGKLKWYMEWGGKLWTAPECRPAAQPFTVYEVRYDLRTLEGKYPEEWLGTRTFLEFFDAEGKLIKKYWGPDWLPQVQAQGAHDWETIAVRGVAPQGAATVGVRVDAPSGMFYSADRNRTQNRHVEVDNFRIYRIDESRDQLALRRFPRLVEPGKEAHLAIHRAATGPRQLRVRLLDRNKRPVSEAKAAVTAGRGLSLVAVPIPANLKAGDYGWEISLLAEGDTRGDKPTISHFEQGVFSDEKVYLPPDGKTDIAPDDANIVRIGRWEDSDPKQMWMHWFGSEIRARFNGTSCSLRCSPQDTGFGGAKTTYLNVVVDEDESNILKVKVDKFNAVVPLVQGLPDAVHSIRIFKACESSEPLRFDGLRLDSGRGLLRPEPMPTRRLEFYGDSVTSGGSATPNYLAYAPMLGRELNADVHIISKGGTGVAASWSHMITLPSYWDKLACSNFFDASKATKWDFTRWTPDCVLILIGHNDQFNGGGGIFGERYKTFVGSLRTVYPKAHILCANTLISNPVGHFQGAVTPLIASDPNLSFAFQWSAWSDPKTAHPPTPAHEAMVKGSKDAFSMADVVEDRMGWGLLPPDASKTSPR